MPNILLFIQLVMVAFSPVQTKEGKAKLTITENTIKLGEVYPGVRYDRKFVFKNTGTAPLIITDIESGCGCTVVEFSKEPVMPGKEGELTVAFTPKEDYGFTSKSFTITSNAENATEYVYLQATIVKKNGKK